MAVQNKHGAVQKWIKCCYDIPGEIGPHGPVEQVGSRACGPAWAEFGPALGATGRSSPAQARLQGKAFPRFRANANDHVNPQAVDASARARMKLLEAFTPSQPVGDRKRFAGRTEILTHLIRAIEEQRLHTVLYGSRGLGKTSVLHVLAQAARDARYLVGLCIRRLGFQFR